MFKQNFLLISLISFVVSLFISHHLPSLKVIQSFYYFTLCLVFLFLLISYKKIIFLILFFLFLGFWRYQIIFQRNPNLDISNFSGHSFILRGQVFSQPEINGSKQKIKLKIYQGLDDHNNTFKLRGRILIFSTALPLYNFGDFLEIEGEYLKAEKIDNFDYALYLKRFGIDSIVYHPKIKKIEKETSFSESFFYKIFFLNKYAFEALKNKIIEQFYFCLDLEESAILRAMILADKSGLEPEMKKSFSVSGLSHIVAISGLHISLLSSIFLNLLLFLGFSKKRSFYFLIVFLIFYLNIISFPASACRASLMSSLALFALYQGRDSELNYLLYFSAIFLLMLNPLMLFIDIGFQLSFLAVFSILYIHPKIKNFLVKKINLKINNYFYDVVSISISVQILTAPILISSFNQISLISPISNLLVLFLLPFIISLSVLAILLGFIFPFFAKIIYLLLNSLLSYILLISNYFSSLKFSFLELDNWNIFFSIIYYLLVYYFFRNKK